MALARCNACTTAPPEHNQGGTQQRQAQHEMTTRAHDMTPHQQAQGRHRTAPMDTVPATGGKGHNQAAQQRQQSTTTHPHGANGHGAGHRGEGSGRQRHRDGHAPLGAVDEVQRLHPLVPAAVQKCRRWEPGSRMGGSTCTAGWDPRLRPLAATAEGKTEGRAGQQTATNNQQARPFKIRT